MSEPSWLSRGRSFGPGAVAYGHARPGYALDALSWALGNEPLAVLDLGAGTGLLSRQLLERGHRTTAVEPDAAMLAQLAATTPGLAGALHGSAEDIPVADATQDAIVIGQAYHWFNPELAHIELARVTKPGGVLAALWNLRDDQVGWSADLTDILRDEDIGTDPRTAAAICRHGALAALQSGSGLQGWLANPTFGNDFGSVAQGLFTNSTRCTPLMLLDLVRSRSYYLTAPPDRAAELEARVQDLIDSHAGLRGRAEFELRYITVVLRAERKRDTPAAGPGRRHPRIRQSAP